MSENFPNMMKTLNLEIQESPAKETERKLNQSTSESSCLKLVIKGKIYKQAEEKKTYYIQRNKAKDYSRY